MMLHQLRTPVVFLEQALGELPHREALRELESWWERKGKAVSQAVDRAGTPWLRMFDSTGRRVDEILFPDEYWCMLRRGYRDGAVWRAFEENSMIPACLFLYLVSFYDPGLSCPYTVSLATAVALAKYGGAELEARFLPQMLRKDDEVWQGATWMTEVGGGSDLGANVETVAVPAGERWALSGDKYFASNAGAELAVVAARPQDAAAGVRGLALFLVPRRRENGELNYTIRRLKDKIATRSVPTGEIELRESEGYLLGRAEQGIYLILEVLNISRVANSMGSVALAQRALADAIEFAGRRIAFGKPVLELPLFRRQVEQRIEGLRAALALAWEAARLLNEVWRERPPYSDQYFLFRLVAHLAKYWTAEYAAQTAKWSIEAHGGLGVLEEFGVERWLREALILAIWEGTAHRQMLDGLEVMERKQAHRLLFQRLCAIAPSSDLKEMESRVERHLTLPGDEREAGAEALFADLAAFTAHTLAKADYRLENDPRFLRRIESARRSLRAGQGVPLERLDET